MGGTYSVFKREKIALGDGYIDKITIFESKRFFSIYVHIYHAACQDRLHTHAFNALACVLKGGYVEFVKRGTSLVPKVIKPGIRYIPRSYNHCINSSLPGTISIVFAGPWAATWLEEKDGRVRTLTWGRNEI